MVYGLPEFRLPKRIVEEEVEELARMGVEVRTSFLVGRTRGLRELLEEDGFDALFAGSGAGLPKFLGIPGENMVGVFSANEYLTRSNLMRAYDSGRADTPIFRPRRAVGLGGGKVAMDAARTALRLGAEEVHLLYRRTREEMPARAEEIAHAEEEGVTFRFLESPARVLGDDDGRVRSLECLSCELGEADGDGRRRPRAGAAPRDLSSTGTRGRFRRRRRAWRRPRLRGPWGGSRRRRPRSRLCRLSSPGGRG